MDYSKYENTLPCLSIKDELKYKQKLLNEINNMTASGGCIQSMIADVPNKVKKWRVKQQAAYTRENIRLYLLFKEDALEETGLNRFPEAFQNKLFLNAWEHGHDFGYSEVMNHLVELSEMMDGFDVTEKHV